MSFLKKSGDLTNSSSANIMKMEDCFWRWKRDLVWSLSQFRTIDNRAICAPYELKESPKKLIAYLTEGLDSPIERIRIISMWIASHICYDTEHIWPSSAPKDVLKSGKAICSGYSRLMEYMCKLSNIQCKYVSGLARGVNFSPTTKLIWDESSYNLTGPDPNEHAWNLVFVNNRWHLIDITWAAGILAVSESGKKSFQFQWNEEWFLVDPQHFVITHIPYKNRLPYPNRQNLRRPVTNLSDWANSAVSTPLFFDLGLDLVESKQLWIEADEFNVGKIVFQSTYETILVAKLYAIETGRQIPDFCMVSADETAITVRIFLPFQGSYKLEIYGGLVFAEKSLTDLKLLALFGVRGSAATKHNPLPTGCWPYWGPNYLLRMSRVRLVSHCDPWLSTHTGLIDMTFSYQTLNEWTARHSFPDVMISLREGSKPKNLKTQFFAWRDRNSVFIRICLPSVGRYILTISIFKPGEYEHSEVAANYLLKSKLAVEDANVHKFITAYPGFAYMLGPRPLSRTLGIRFSQEIGFTKVLGDTWLTVIEFNKTVVETVCKLYSITTDNHLVKSVISPFITSNIRHGETSVSYKILMPTVGIYFLKFETGNSTVGYRLIAAYLLEKVDQTTAFLPS